jgi:hypothetical protein
MLLILFEKIRFFAQAKIMYVPGNAVFIGG